MDKKYKRLHWVWSEMKQRCDNPNDKSYKNYGAKGIKVCNEWKESFEKFKKWSTANGYVCYGDDKKYTLSLDRINVNGNYEPNNCRWVDYKIQANNKTNNHYITINGVTKTMSEWSDYSGINYSTIRQRTHLGFTDDDILKPVKKINTKHKENDPLIICGKTKTIKEWRKIYGIKYTTMRRRLEHGYTGKDLIREPHSGSSPQNKEVV